tara:strand:- start:1231 stop:1395 length:165 start_codon:yes stop_codon:yes gene_type:complete
MKKQTTGYILVIIGFILIIAKAIDYFVPGESLIPGLTLLGLLFVALGLLLSKKK